MKSRLHSYLHSAYGWFTVLLNKLQKNRKYSLLINGFLLMITLFFLTKYISKEWQTIKEFQIQLLILPLILSFILYGINYFLFVISWHIIIKAFGVKSTLITNSYIYSYSQIAKILPTPAWFIAGRLVLYKKEGAKEKVILTSTFLEIILHMVVGLVILALISISSSNYSSWLYGLSLIPLIVLILSPKLLNFSFLKIYDSNFSKSDMFFLILIFAITWILSGPFFQYLLSGCGISVQIPMTKLWQIWIISSIFAYIGSLTLGGIGILREFSITFLLGNLVSLPYAAVIAAVSRVIMTIGNLLWPLLIMGVSNLTRRTGKIEEDS